MTIERAASFTACRDPKVLLEFDRHVRRLARRSDVIPNRYGTESGWVKISAAEPTFFDELYRRRYNPDVMPIKDLRVELPTGAFTDDTQRLPRRYVHRRMRFFPEAEQVILRLTDRIDFTYEGSEGKVRSNFPRPKIYDNAGPKPGNRSLSLRKDIPFFEALLELDLLPPNSEVYSVMRLLRSISRRDRVR